MVSISAEDLPTRWEIELEFVQSLSNVQYLTYLAQTGHLEDSKFLNYLEYLEYWRKPEYAKQLVYPNCLHILTLLRSPQFRKEIAKTELNSVLFNDMVERWKEPLLQVSGSTPKKESVPEPAPAPESDSVGESEINSKADEEVTGNQESGDSSGEKQNGLSNGTNGSVISANEGQSNRETVTNPLDNNEDGMVID